MLINSRAGHATTPQRQRDHVFKKKNCGLLHYAVCGSVSGNIIPDPDPAKTERTDR